MSEVLDLLDKKILLELDIDCRQNNSQIAKKLNVNKQVVNYRINKLETSGVIKYYYTVINMSRLGYISNRLFFRLKSISTEKEKEIIDYFVKDDKYWGMVVSKGLIDIGVATWESNIIDILKRKEEYMVLLNDSLQYYIHSLHLQFYIFRKEYLVNTKIKTIPPILMIKNKTLEHIDELDYNILRIISNNSRLSLIEIANKINSTVDVVRYRLKKLVSCNVIEGFRCAIDVSKLGYQMYKVELFLKDYKLKDKMLNYFEAQPNIVYAYETTNNDLEFEVEVKDIDEFLEILADIRNKFNDIIKSYSQVLWYKEYKVLFFNK